MQEFLHTSNLFEKVEENKKREMVLGMLNEIVQNWAKEISVKKGMSEELAKDIEAKIYTFGSYKLGVHASSSDIDTLCIAPNNITIDDFFETLYQKLKSHNLVTNIVCVKEAYVPVMNFEFDGVQVKFLKNKNKNNFKKRLISFLLNYQLKILEKNLIFWTKIF